MHKESSEYEKNSIIFSEVICQDGSGSVILKVCLFTTEELFLLKSSMKILSQKIA